MTVVETATETRQEVVLARFEQNLYHDSYFYEVTWDGESVKCKETGSTAYGGGFFTKRDKASAKEDADARQSLVEPLFQVLLADEQRRAHEPHEGRMVRSTTTRGKNVGVSGLVKEVRVNDYADNRNVMHYRVKVELTGTGEMRWLDANRVEVTTPGEVDEAAVRTLAERRATHRSWRELVEGRF